MDFAREVSDQVIFMADGHIIEQGASKDRFSVIRNMIVQNPSSDSLKNKRKEGDFS